MPERGKKMGDGAGGVPDETSAWTGLGRLRRNDGGPAGTVKGGGGGEGGG